MFCSILKISNITLEQYKEKKQKIKSDEKIALEFGYHLPADYFERKSELLEKREFLQCDKLWFSKTELQALLKKNGSMILTKRRCPTNLKWQLDKLGIDVPVATPGKQTKLQWIEDNFPKEDSVMIGDSIMDLETAYLPNISSVMVGYGLGTKEEFDSLAIPYFYLSSPEEMFCYLKNYR